MTPRHRSLRRARLAQSPDTARRDRTLSDTCAQMFLLARSLQDAGVEPVERKRRLLAGLCQLADADRALCVVTRTDVTTGRQHILSAVAVMTVAAPVQTRSRGSGRQIVGVEANPPLDGQAPDADGPAMDDFCWIDGLKLAAGITLSRSRGRPRFDDASRSVVATIHQRCRWIYEHDRRLAALIESGTADDEEVRLLQSLLQSENGQHTSRADRARLPALLSRLNATSRRDLIERWAGDESDRVAS